jgi:hypothetical protein
MTAPTPEILEARKWCVEKAILHCGEPEAMPALAAQLISLLETGRLPAEAAPASVTLDMSTLLLGDPESVEPDAGAPCTPDGAGDWPGVPSTRPSERGPTPPDDLPRSIPRPAPPRLRPSHIDRAEDGPTDLSARDQAVLEVLKAPPAGEGWPSHPDIAEATDIPRGSIGAVLEQLHQKGYLARPNGKWALTDKAGVST